MSVASNNTTITADDLLAMPDGDSYELVNGKLVERNMGFQSSRVGGQLFGKMLAHCDENGLGWVLPADNGYQCFADDPERVRKPDVSFIRAERLSADEEPKGYARIAPDLVAEVVSPNDKFEELSVKISEYLAAGVQVGWVIDPATQRVHVYHQDGRGYILSSEDELSGEDVIPKFRCKVSELFRPPKGV